MNTINSVAKELFDEYRDVDMPYSSYPIDDITVMQEMVSDVYDKIGSLKKVKKNYQKILCRR